MFRHLIKQKLIDQSRNLNNEFTGSPFIITAKGGEEASLVVSGELQEAFIVIIICQILEQSLCWAGGGKC